MQPVSTAKYRHWIGRKNPILVYFYDNFANALI